MIIVTTPMSSHYEYAKKVLQAGKNCVVEKPFTSTVKEAEELFALAKEKGLMLQGYQNRRLIRISSLRRRSLIQEFWEVFSKWRCILIIIVRKFRRR